MMMTGEGALQSCHNAQLASREGGIVVAAAVTRSPRDVHQLVAMIDAVEPNTGVGPGVGARTC
jgi:hypothetical protein